MFEHWTNIVIAACLLVLVGVAPARANAAPAEPELVVYKHTTDAGDNPVKLKLHIFKPQGWAAEDKRPAIVFFFGGGWVSGSPTQFYLQSRELADRGMVAICAEYRIFSKHKTPPQACVEDGKSAVRYVRANAQRLGIDPARIAAGGGSAGGHVAASAGVLKGYEAEGEDKTISSVPDLLVLFNPVIDTSPETGYGAKKITPDPLALSPVHQVGKGAPPSLILQGDADTTTPVPSARAYKTKCQELGIQCVLKEYEGEGHGFFNTGGYREVKPGKTNYHQLTMQEVVAFLKSHGYLAEEAE